MKRYRILIILSIIMLMISGCGNDNKISSNSKEAYNEQDSTDKQDNTQKEEQAEKIGGFNKITYEQEKELVEVCGSNVNEDITKVIVPILSDIGVEHFLSVTWGNFDKSNDIINTVDISCNIVTDKRNLLVSMLYVIDEWSVSYVKEINSGHIYYVPEELKNTIDLYNYTDDTLISSKTENHKDVQDRIDKEIENADKEFNENLDKLREKYGLGNST